ncbi:MAG: cryptochrome/photolyase family protein [Oscillochloridaceae bacterium]|nr:cryptochrome/photolyase family protein [Chloroflexaceae bacterium]MDW8391289.1 cryptochrome/photolyase family protein [Oscillochloridaceae bacterium]
MTHEHLSHSTAPITVWILGDQLLREHPALLSAEAAVGRAGVRVLLIESAARLRQQPYQRKKLVLLLSAMRHYAARLTAMGYQVDYRQAPDFLSGLRAHCTAYRTAQVLTMAAAEEPTRRFQQDEAGPALGAPVEVLPNTQFLVGRFDPFPDAPPERTIIMATFYKAMRRRFNVLLDGDGAPVGGRWSYDVENRKPLPRSAQPPPPPRFPPDAITRAVMEEVAALPTGIGNVEGFDLAVTAEEADLALERFIVERLPDFGAYEDAMTRRSALIYHSGLSPYLNLGLLTPMQLVRAAEAAYAAGRAPLNSVEGFVRQVLGWREYIYWQYWRRLPILRSANRWNATRPLPAWFWTGDTDMACLRHVLQGVLNTGYTHHIERLMVICNFCLLAGIEPQAVNTWFLAAYVDAYEWVMFPNVIGMGLNADDGVATKPYIASANYINAMSDYCGGCRYHPRQRTGPNACPYNLLYWNFLIEHETALRANPRLGPAVLGLGRLAPNERTTIRREAAAFLERVCGE